MAPRVLLNVGPEMADSDQYAPSKATGPTHAGTEVPAASGGLPQFEFQHWAGQIAYLLVLFAILYVLMARVFAPRIRKVFDERARTISEALTSARAVQREADAQAAAARKALDDARAAAQRTAADAKAKAAAESLARQTALSSELSDKLILAEAGIRRARDEAMTSVSAIASDAASAIVDKLTGLAPTAEEITVAATSLRG